MRCNMRPPPREEGRIINLHLNRGYKVPQSAPTYDVVNRTDDKLMENARLHT